MNNSFGLDILLPVLLLVLQVIVLLFFSFWLLSKVKVLKKPYSGMEYSQVIIAAIFVFSVLLISTSDISGIFQTYKTFQNGDGNLFYRLFSKFSQFFMVVLVFQALFIGISYFSLKILLGFKKSIEEIENGDIPVTIIIAAILLAFAIAFQFASKEVIELIIPQLIYFR